MHYDVTIPADAREATERALAVHPAGCPAHESVKDAIPVTWDAKVRIGDDVIELSSDSIGTPGGGA
jgi:hypothetical protein